MRKIRTGLTMVELLAVLSMSGVIAGIALPVVQDSREDARRIQCAKQIGDLQHGSALYESANGRMPPLTTGPGPGSSPFFISPHQFTGTLAFVLPFVEQQELFDLMPPIATQADVVFDPGAPPPNNSIAGLLQDPGMAIAIREKPSEFICPSNAGYSVAPIERLDIGVLENIEPGPHFFLTLQIPIIAATEFGRTSYLPTLGGFNGGLASIGRGIEISQEDSRGAIRNRLTSIPVSELGDGASNTICWGESLGQINPANDPNNQTGGPLLEGANFALLSPALLTGQRFITFAGSEEAILFGSAEASHSLLIGSMHPEGNNIAMCDGSVRFLNRHTNQGVAAALGCGNDGWIVPRN